MKPAVSVVIPAYNSEKHIIKALSSLKNQTFKSLEVIVVNDGSTDKTSEIAENILSESDLDWKIINQENRGVSIARNVGLSSANGDYICFLDSDDYVHETFVERMYKKAKEFDSDIVFCKYNLVSEYGRTLYSYDELFDEELILEISKKSHTGIEVLREHLRDNIHLGLENVIYRKAFLMRNHLSFTPHCWYGEDLEFVIKALLLAKRVTCVPEVLTFYVRHEESVTGRKEKYWEKLLTLDEMFKRVENFISKSVYTSNELLKLLESYRKRHLIGLILMTIAYENIRDINEFTKYFRILKEFQPKTYTQLLIKILAIAFPMRISLKIIKILTNIYDKMRKRN